MLFMVQFRVAEYFQLAGTSIGPLVLPPFFFFCPHIQLCQFPIYVFFHYLWESPWSTSVMIAHRQVMTAVKRRCLLTCPSPLWANTAEFQGCWATISMGGHMQVSSTNLASQKPFSKETSQEQGQNLFCNLSQNDLVSLGAHFGVDYSVDKKKILKHRQHLFFIVTLNYLANFSFSLIANWAEVFN